jgi:hypothetical protein
MLAHFPCGRSTKLSYSGRSGRPFLGKRVCTVSTCERFEKYSPAAIETAPENTPTAPVNVALLLVDAAAGATPTIKLALEAVPQTAHRSILEFTN